MLPVVCTGEQNIATYLQMCKWFVVVVVNAYLSLLPLNALSDPSHVPYSRPHTPTCWRCEPSRLALPPCPLQVPSPLYCLTKAIGFQSYQQVSAIGLQKGCIPPLPLRKKEGPGPVRKEEGLRSLKTPQGGLAPRAGI